MNELYRDHLLIRPLVACTCALMAGIVCAAKGWSVASPWLLVGVSLWSWWRWYTRRAGLMLGLLGLSFAWGVTLAAQQRARQLSQWQKATALPPGNYWIEGTIKRRIGWRKHRLRLLFRVDRYAEDGLRWRRSQAHIQLHIIARQSVWQWPRMAQLDRGDRLRTIARLRPPRWYANPGLYDPRPQMRADGTRLLGKSRLADIVLLAQGTQHPQRWLSQHRTSISFWLERTLQNQTHAGLLRALLLGDRGGISPELRTQFGRTGTSHLLAISGLHLAIVAHLCFLLWGAVFARSRALLERGQHRLLAACATAPVILAYAALSGASASTQRACLMLLFVWCGMLCARKHDVTQTLSLVAICILMWEPYALFSASFQLSFLAVAVLVWSVNQSGSHFIKHRWVRPLWQSLQASSWATLATLPIALSLTPYIPLWAPLINLVAIPLGGYLVVGMGLASLLVYTLSPGLAAWVLFGAKLAAECFLQWVAWTSTWVGCFQLPPMRHWEIAAYTSWLATWLLRAKRRFCLLALAVASILTVVAWWPKTTRRPLLTLHFLDVGQGDATLVQFPNGQHMLVDAGGSSYGHFSVGERVLLPHFRWMRLTHLDMAVLSHPHPDHFGGLIGLLGQLPIHQFWTTGQPGNHPHFRHLQQKLARHQIPIKTFRRPTKVNIGGVTVQVLHPFPGANEGGTYYWSLHANDNSLVLLLQFGDIKILLTGDIEARGEELLLARWPQLRADVLKAPHHGSRTSSTDALVKQLAPQHVIFCVGRYNRHGFPHRAVLQRYKRHKVRAWRTDQHGRISLQTDGTKLSFQTYMR